MLVYIIYLLFTIDLLLLKFIIIITLVIYVNRYCVNLLLLLFEI